eukprot:TRINITY_DN12958_c0_g1_i1.p2 TRINITY_DN12958_c0_g1~~TRINITY_DN12958_c0_g1_i1.p2  ORF type:complete len:152 (+),score=20.08 TRINITY_DN12958_c0_g1_i1:69-524(+)
MPYYSSKWDPILILSQIVIVQATFYLSAGLFLHVFHGKALGMNSFFDHREVNITSKSGILTVLAFLLSLVLNAATLFFVVERASKCWDFAATVFIIHLGLCWVLVAFPSSLTWWVVFVVATVGMDLLSEWVCMRKEMHEIVRDSVLRDFDV